MKTTTMHTHLCRAFMAGLTLALFFVANSAQAQTLELYFPFDEAPGTTTLDNAASAINGTIVNGGTIVAGGAPGSFNPGGNAIEFTNDDNHFVDTGFGNMDAGISQAGGFVASFWINRDDTSGDSMVLGNREGGDSLHLGTRNDQMHMGLWASDIGNGGTVTPGTWQHVTMVNNNGAGQVYVNGVFTKSGFVSPNPGLANKLIKIGTAENGGGFDGKIDEVLLYSLTSSEKFYPNQAAFLAGGGDPNSLIAGDPNSIPGGGGTATGRINWVESSAGVWNKVELHADTFFGTTYDQAKAAAATVGGITPHLATPRSSAENAGIAGVLDGASVWFGLDDIATEGDWRLQDAGNDLIWQGEAGGSAQGGAFTNWNPGEPNNVGGENAGEFGTNGLWNDLPNAANNQKRQFVVETEDNLGAKPALSSHAFVPPATGRGQWAVTTLRNGFGGIDNADKVDMAFYSQPGGNLTNTNHNVINFKDAQDATNNAVNNFGQDQDFGPGEENNFQAVAVAQIIIPAGEGGVYTFGFASDDGGRLRIKGQTFLSNTGGTIDGETLSGGCCGNYLGTVNLAPGTYDIEATFYENTGEATWEVIAAKGNHTTITTADFRPVGYRAGDDPALSNLPNKQIPAVLEITAGNGWQVKATNPGANGLIGSANGAAIAEAEAALAAGPTTTVFASVIDYADPENNGGQSGSPFPTDTGADDEDFAVSAQAILSVPVDGVYRFGFNGDDGGYLQIVGVNWDSIVTNATGLSVINGDRLECDCLTGGSNTVGEITLQAGVNYVIKGLFLERAGGAHWEIFGGTADFPLELLATGTPQTIAPPADFDGVQLVPEPSSFILAALGLVGLLLGYRRRRRNA